MKNKFTDNLDIILSILKTPRYRLTLIAGLLGALTALGLFLVLPESGEADLYEYYGVTSDETVVFLNSARTDMPVLYEKGRYYAALDAVQKTLNERFYYDEETGGVLYVLPEETRTFLPGDGTQDLIARDNVRYIALDTVKEFTALEYDDFGGENEPRRLWIRNDYGVKVAETIVGKDTVLRTEAGKLGRVVAKEEVGTQVRVLEEKGRWAQVLTADGHLGYVKRKHLLEVRERIRINDDFAEQDYTGETVKGTISLGFDYIDNVSYGLDVLKGHLEMDRAVNVLTPTWFVLHGGDGDFSSCADPAYVALAHENGKQVWIMIENITGGCDTEALLKSRKARGNLIRNLTEAVEACGADGINLDFEAMPEALVPHYMQFIRELKQVCIEKKIILSVDTFSPYSWNLKYDHTELGKVADYVIIMGYDESWAEPGPNSDTSFIDFSCKRSQELIPGEKLIIAVPFYTRAWSKGEKDWIRSEVYMRDCPALMEACGDLAWDEEVGCYHGHVEMDGVEKEIWFEDVRSMEARLDVISKYVVKGIAAWRLGQEDPGVWELFRKLTK